MSVGGLLELLEKIWALEEMVLEFDAPPMGPYWGLWLLGCENVGDLRRHDDLNLSCG